MPVSHQAAAAILKKSNARRFSEDVYVFGSGYVKLSEEICEIGVSHYKLKTISIKGLLDDNAFIEATINQAKLYDMQSEILINCLPNSCTDVKHVAPSYFISTKTLTYVDGKDRSPMMVIIGTGLPLYDTADKMLHASIVDESIVLMQLPSSKPSCNYSLIYSEELSNPKCNENVKTVIGAYLARLYELQTFTGYKLFESKSCIT